MRASIQGCLGHRTVQAAGPRLAAARSIARSGVARHRHHIGCRRTGASWTVRHREHLVEAIHYIPGVRPGKPTADFLDYTMTRLTFAGALFLTAIAILPQLLSHGLNVPTITAQFFGGTSLLIIVGVILDTMRQVETHLIQRHYDGFLRKGRIRGRSFDRASYSRGEAAGQGMLMWLYVGIAVLVIGGVAIFLYGR